ncbi:MAG TPA: hypothetical protein VEA38_08745 [Terriglobales bacterium]|nr:hypothetical protein [Terriglobales bacterium]
MRDRFTHALAAGQGLYFFATGVWPLLSMRTFEAVTGPKADRWLVKTVGVLVGVIGAVLAMAGARRRVEPEAALLAAGSAAGLAAIDTVYATKGRISKIYLLDAVVEVALIAAWVVAARGVSRAGGASRRSTRPARRRAGRA